MSAGGYRAAAIDGTGLRVGIVVTDWNHDIVGALSAGARAALGECGVREIVEVVVPGAFEVPMGARLLATSGRVDAIVTLGAVIRGDTPHFDYVCGPCADGVARVQLDTGVPVTFGVLTVNTAEQARERTLPTDQGGVGNKGYEAAVGAVQMALLARELAPR